MGSSGSGGGGGGDDGRRCSTPLPEDGYTCWGAWLLEELTRRLERVLGLAGDRFLSNMPACNGGASTNAANKNLWMNWMRALLDGRIALYADRGDRHSILEHCSPRDEI